MQASCRAAISKRPKAPSRLPNRTNALLSCASRVHACLRSRASAPCRTPHCKSHTLVLSQPHPIHTQILTQSMSSQVPHSLTLRPHCCPLTPDPAVGPGVVALHLHSVVFTPVPPLPCRQMLVVMYLTMVSGGVSVYLRYSTICPSVGDRGRGVFTCGG